MNFAMKTTSASKAAVRPARMQTSSRMSVVRPVAAYGEESKFFDLKDMENTTGSWDMYGQEAKGRYPPMQATFFTQAADLITKREAFLLFAAGTGGAAISLFGLVGAKDINLPILTKPTKTENGKGGTIRNRL